MEHYCEKHPETRLVCPKCNAAKGGRSTAKRHDMSKIGRKGGKAGKGSAKPRQK